MLHLIRSCSNSEIKQENCINIRLDWTRKQDFHNFWASLAWVAVNTLEINKLCAPLGLSFICHIVLCEFCITFTSY